MLALPQLQAAVSRIAAKPASATFTRRLPVRSLFRISDPVPAPGSPMTVTAPDFFFITGSPYRYNPPGLPALYFGEGEAVSGAEVKQHPGALGFDVTPSEPHTTFHVTITLSSVLDLTDPATWPLLDTTQAELLDNWRLLSPGAPTQLLGKSVFNSGLFEAIRYQSAAMAKETKEAFCLAIFPGRLQTKSLVEIYDPSRTFVQKL